MDGAGCALASAALKRRAILVRSLRDALHDGCPHYPGLLSHERSILKETTPLAD